MEVYMRELISAFGLWLVELSSAQHELKQSRTQRVHNCVCECLTHGQIKMLNDGATVLFGRQAGALYLQANNESNDQ